VRCCGGGDEPEAVDVALQRAIKEPQLSRVILIGDAPPHSAPRDRTQEAESLANGNIPVFSVVVVPVLMQLQALAESPRLPEGGASPWRERMSFSN